MKSGEMTGSRSVSGEVRWFYIRVIVIAYLIWIAAFEAVGFFAATLPTHDPTSFLDTQIPMIPAFVWPYELCYVFPLLTVVLIKDWHKFNIALLAVVMANIVAFLIYILYPVTFDRPTLGDTLSERVLASEFSRDFQPGANKLPSLHVAYSWITFMACRKQSLGKLGDIVVFLAALLITISTVFVKQHIMIDAITGILLACASLWIGKRVYNQLIDPRADPRVALKAILKKMLPVIVGSLAVIVLVAWLRYRNLLVR